ncbi:hypothetical protein NOF04DRAFT_1277643 [Fusarium oxysporum II5]|nr:hypothetical protein NOF04DRAFT_1277643 [Fusarium oxysporum II5]
MQASLSTQDNTLKITSIVRQLIGPRPVPSPHFSKPASDDCEEKLARGAIRQNTKAGNITSSLHRWQDTASLPQVPRGEPKAGDFVEKHFVEFGQFWRKGQQLWVLGHHAGGQRSVIASAYTPCSWAIRSYRGHLGLLFEVIYNYTYELEVLEEALGPARLKALLFLLHGEQIQTADEITRTTTLLDNDRPKFLFYCRLILSGAGIVPEELTILDSTDDCYHALLPLPSLCAASSELDWYLWTDIW